LRNYDPANPRDLVFIPVGINYDRTLEDRTLLLDTRAEPAKRGLWATAAKTTGFLCHNLMLMARGHWHRLGYACVNFGAPISMKTYLAEHGIDFRRLDREERFARVGALAALLMARIGAMVPVLPVSLVALVLCDDAEASFDELQLKTRVGERLEALQLAGAHIYIPRSDMDYAIQVGLRMLVLRHLVSVADGLYRAVPDELPLLRYYANALAHFPVGTETPTAN